LDFKKNQFRSNAPHNIGGRRITVAKDSLEAIIFKRHPKSTRLIPIVAKVGGLQSQGAKGEVVVNLLRTLGNAGSGVLRLSRLVGSSCRVEARRAKPEAESEAQRVNNMASNRPHPLNSPWIGNQKWGHFDDFLFEIQIYNAPVAMLFMQR